MVVGWGEALAAGGQLGTGAHPCVQTHACVLRTCIRHMGSLEMLMDHTQHVYCCSQVIAHTQITPVHVQIPVTVQGDVLGITHRPRKCKDILRLGLWPGVLEVESETGVGHMELLEEAVWSGVLGARMWYQAKSVLA